MHLAAIFLVIRTLAAGLANPYGLTIGPDGALYFCEVDRHRVARVDLKTAAITTIAGTGEKGYHGDGALATAARLNQPYELLFDKSGNLYFVEMQNHVVRRVDAKTRLISTLAGTGVPGFSGDNGPAAKAQFRQPHAIALHPSGDLLICDTGNNRIRRIRLSTGIINTYAGTGERGDGPDGDPLGCKMNRPHGVFVAADGAVYIGDSEASRIRVLK